MEGAKFGQWGIVDSVEGGAENEKSGGRIDAAARIGEDASMGTVSFPPPATPSDRPFRKTVRSPAKLNLGLWVTGRRDDGFHNLVSVVAPLDWGDELEVEVGAPGPDRLFASGAPEGFPTGPENLILRAAASYREAGGVLPGAVRVRVTKRIPPESGLGGGSGNGTWMLRVLNEASPSPMSPEALRELAAVLGSDCPLFLEDGPVILRGRGERIEALGAAEAARLMGRQAVVFRPEFGVETPWAYGQLAAAPERHYRVGDDVEARLAAWRAGTEPAEALVENSFTAVVGRRYLVIPALLGEIRKRWGWAAELSGSGSACFALVPPGADAAPVVEFLKSELGSEALVVSTVLAGGGQVTG